MFAAGKRFASLTGYTAAVLARSKPLLFALAAMALMFAVPSLYPMGTGGAVFSPSYYEMVHDSLESSIVSARGEIPPAVLEAREEKERLLDEIASAAGTPEYYAAVARYERYASDTLGVGGTLVYEGLDPRISYRATALLTQRISELDHPEVYASSDQAPALFYVLLCVESCPYAIVLAPMLIAAFSLVRTRSGRGLLTAAPVSPFAEFAAGALAVLAVSAASLALVCLPSGAVSLLRNGLGDPAYPVVYVYDDTVFETTVGAVGARYAVLYLLSCAFFAALSSLLSSLLPAVATKGALVALVAAPLLQKAVALATASESVPFLPTAYIDIPSIIGYPAYAIGGNISQVEGLSFEGAVAAFGAGCLAAAAAAGLLGLLSRRPLPAGGGRPAALEVDGLSIRYGRKVVCEGVSFDVRAGDVVGLVAPNGYGKTSVLCALGGNGPFQQGRVSADGFDKRRSRARFRRKVLLLPDRGQILHPELTVREHLKLASALWGTGRPWEEAARRCGALPC